MPIFRRIGVGPSYSWSFSERWSRFKAEIEVSHYRVMVSKPLCASDCSCRQDEDARSAR